MVSFEPCAVPRAGNGGPVRRSTEGGTRAPFPPPVEFRRPRTLMWVLASSGGMPSMVRWQCIATGRVQGVNYRARVVESAIRHRILGSVANRPDGTVFIDAQGDSESLRAFLDDIRGPRGASHAHSVERIAIVPVSTELDHFEIAR